jgi:myosin heavy subunit
MEAEHAFFNHPKDSWFPCIVKSRGGGKVNVKTESGEEFTAEETDVVPMHPSSMNPVDDMVKLGDLNEAAILHNLRLRFQQDDIYTYIGPIQIACNPYKALPWFTSAYVTKYHERNPAEQLPPHVYELANNALRNMLDHKRGQSVVISGESGAGKTESTKLVLQFLAEVAGQPGGGQEQLLLDSSPILEAFGNSKTARNNNSSRFGKYMEIEFNTRGTIEGGKINKYLLEKTRIVTQGPHERNYHVFFHLFYLPKPQQAQLKLGSDAGNYHYLNQVGPTTVEGIDDESDFNDMQNAFASLKIPKSEQDAIYACIAGVLMLGNVKYGPGGEGVTVVSEEVLNDAAELLGVTRDSLNFLLCFRTLASPGGRSEVLIPLKDTEAVEARDGLAKAIYSRLFDWMVERINTCIKCPKPVSKDAKIGVLDIFGFEIFEVNSFEQLCINLANEKLQYHFNAHIFLLEQAAYAKEGIDVGKISFSDNQGCLELLEKKPTGVLPMIDEENSVPRGSDDGLLAKLHSTHGKDSFYKKPRSQNNFVVCHYAGDVPYDVRGFLEKNKDVLPDAIRNNMGKSDEPLIAELFVTPAEPAAGAGRRRGNKKQLTLGGQFKASLQSLYDTLCATEPHFIKCVKTNTVKRPGIFDSVYALRQLQYLGLLEVIRIRKAGYPVRMDDRMFFGRYSLLASASTAKDLIFKIGLKDQWQVGKTQFFMRDDMYFALETKRAGAMETSVKIIQGLLREELTRRNWRHLRDSMVHMQAAVRGALARVQVTQMEAGLAVEEQCREAIQARSKFALETALSKASEANLNSSIVQEARKVFDVVQKEHSVNTQFQAASEAQSIPDLEAALADAKKMCYKGATVADAERLLQTLQASADSAANATTPKAAEAELKMAIAMPDSDGKRKQLALWISRAKTVSLSGATWDAAIAEQSTLSERLQIQNSLQEAVDKGEKEQLAHAIAAAKQAGFSNREALADAEASLANLDKIIEANTVLAAVCSNPTEADLEKALANAAALNMMGDKVLHATELLRKLKAGADAKPARLRSQTFVQRMAQNSKQFTFHKYSQLVSGGANVPNTIFSRHRIKRPMTKFMDIGTKDTKLRAAVVSNFANILGYLGEKNMPYPVMLALEILQLGHGGAPDNFVAPVPADEIRDEIWCQLMKEGSSNARESVGRVWELIYLCGKTFSPSEKLYPYVQVFVWNRTQHVTSEEGPKVHELAKTTLEELEHVRNDGPPDACPSKEEIDALRSGQRVYCSVEFLDHTTKNVPIDPKTTAAQLLETMGQTLSLASTYRFGLYEEPDFGEGRCLEPKENIMKVMSSWTKLQESGFLGVGKRVVHCKIVFKKRIFNRGSDPSEDVTAMSYQELHLAYSQARYDVVAGNFLSTEMEALLLAALVMQVEHGDHDEQRHTDGFLRDYIDSYIPNHLRGKQKLSVWEKELIKTHARMRGFTEPSAKQNYLRCSAKFNTYGYTLYRVKQTFKPSLPVTVYLGVNYKELAIFRTDDKSKIAAFKYTDLVSNSPTAKTFSITHGSNEQKVNFETKRGTDISSLIKDYVMMRIDASK